jgi:Asp-tRNA(Asn)/Glu-tRNA(Gln) amidotransferase A subunit family amidase
MNVPIATPGSTLPHGVQLVSGMFREDVLFAAAHDIEEREGMRPVITPV